MEPLKIAFVLCGLTIYASGAPTLPDEHAGMSPLLTLKDGNVGVNLLGSKASAGVVGLLQGDASQGLHASAETTFEQNAQALGAPLVPVAYRKAEGHPQEMPHSGDPTNGGNGKIRYRRSAAPHAKGLQNIFNETKQNRDDFITFIYNCLLLNKLMSIIPPEGIPVVDVPKRCGYNC